jgi:hypothetical protein
MITSGATSKDLERHRIQRAWVESSPNRDPTLFGVARPVCVTPAALVGTRAPSGLCSLTHVRRAPTVAYATW